METIDQLISSLPERHRRALLWFIERAGGEHSWPKALSIEDEETLLASKAKGIYKPRWSKYALSVRQSLDTAYPDREPVIRADGTWSFSYFQENDDPEARDAEYTNRGLLECWRDRVPVGVMRQTSPKPAVRYRVLGLATVAGWDGGYFFLEGFSPQGLSRGRGPAGEIEEIIRRVERTEGDGGTFNPTDVIDARERTIAQIVRRRGQVEFRRALLAAYDSRCVLSDCNAIEALEASHIYPYRGPETNAVSNGLLLRADLHSLFDLGLIAIDSENLTVLLAPVLLASSYANLLGRLLRLPSDPATGPSREALHHHRVWSGL